MFFIILVLGCEGIKEEREVHFFSCIKYILCFKCTFGELFPSFHFDVCADLPPGRHTMMLYGIFKKA